MQHLSFKPLYTLNILIRNMKTVQKKAENRVLKKNISTHVFKQIRGGLHVS